MAAALDLAHAGSERAPLPPPVGALTEMLFEALRGAPRELPPVPEADGDALTGDDLHLGLYACWELAYGGWSDVDDDWEWEPSLIALRRRLERRFERAVIDRVATVPDVATGDVPSRLNALLELDDSPSVARFLAAEGTPEQLREMLKHRSAYLLKEADPHVRVIPRLPDRAKAALAEVLADEYGGGRAHFLHSWLFRRVLQAVDLDPRDNAHVDELPGVTLATVNLMSLFAAHARWQGALVGHLALTEMTSSEANRRYGRAMRRAGFDSEDATLYFDEHVEADAVHDVVACYDLAGGLAEARPELADSILFGARALILVEGLLARHLLDAWSAGRSSLRTVAVA